MDDVIDTLKIEVEGEDKSAGSTLDDVIAKLERIKKNTSAGSRSVTNFTKRLESLKSTVDGFKLDKLSQLRFSNNSISKVTQLSEKISDIKDKTSSLNDTIQLSVSNESTSEVTRFSDTLSEIEHKTSSLNDVMQVSVSEESVSRAKQFSDELSDIKDKTDSSTAKTKSFGKEVKNAFSTSVVGKFTNKIKQFTSSVKRIALYRTVRSLISQVTSGFKSGINNLYQYSQSIQGNFASSMDRATSSFLTLKNSIAAAAAPLIEYFIPYIEKAVDKLVDFNNWIAKVFAKLSGKSTYSKAVKVTTTYAEQAGLATDSTKELNDTVNELKRSFAGLDEITVIGENLSDATSSITGASNNSLDPSLMFVEESTTGIWEDIKNKISEIWDGIVLDIKKKALLAYIGVLVTWGKIKGWFIENVINPIKINCLLAYLWFNEHVITPVKNAFTGLWDSITEKAKLAWLGIQIVWAKVSGWFDENLVAPIREIFEKGLWNYIEEKALLAYIGVQIVWGKAKGWFNDNFVKPVSDIFEKGLWNTITEKSRLAWLGVQLVWGESAVGWFDNNFIKPFREISEKGLWGYIEEKAKLACLGVKITIANAVNWVIDRIEKAINGMIIGINWIIDKYNLMGYGFSTVTGASFYYIQEIQPITLNRVQAYKDGGFPEDGFFYANHNELVGQFSNGKTAVANNEQIVEGISNGVSQANEETNSLLRENNRLMRQLLSKDSTIDVSTIASAFNRKNQRDGKVTVPVSV